MFYPKAVIENGYVPDDAEPIGQYAGFVRIAEMPVGELLSCERVGLGGGWHFGVRQGMRADVRVGLGSFFALAKNGV